MAGAPGVPTDEAEPPWARETIGFGGRSAMARRRSLLSGTATSLRSVARTERRKRRRLDVVFLAVGALLIALIAASATWLTRTEHVASYSVGAEVAADGSATVTEVIDYDFGRSRHHGIWREIPDVAPDAGIQVSSATAPADVHVDRIVDWVRIRIGDPARTVSGRHRYTLVYRLKGVVTGGRLRWDAVGTSWKVSIAKAEVHVVAPFRLPGPICALGGPGATGGCTAVEAQAGHLAATVKGLARGQGVTVSAAVVERVNPPALGAVLVPPAREDLSISGLLALAAGASLVGALLAAATTSFLIRRAGRERVARGGAADVAWGAETKRAEALVRCDAADLASLATIEFAPPRELTPTQGGVVLAEGIRDEHKVAWLLQAAIDGRIDIEQHGALVLAAKEGVSAGPILEMAFAGRKELELGSYDAPFSAAWFALDHELAAWERGSGLWDPRGDRRRAFAEVAGPVVAVAGLVMMAVAAGRVHGLHGAGLVVMGAAAALAAAGWATIVRAWELRVRTPRGSGLWLRVESFRRFLAQSEAQHVREAAERGVLREYSAWAVALGEVDHWSRAVAAARRTAPEVFPDPSVDLGPALARAASDSFELPELDDAGSWSWFGGSGRGSGGDGGGFGGSDVGSGAGGGGGGSW